VVRTSSSDRAAELTRIAWFTERDHGGIEILSVLREGIQQPDSFLLENQLLRGLW
jgi:hypothetical protein